MSQLHTNQGLELLRIYLSDRYLFAIEISAWIVAIFALLVFAVIVIRWRRRRFKVVSLDISLGGIGSVQLQPREEDIDLAHKIWTELVTRKAAVPVDPKHDVIVEIYDSWYALFGRVRELISQIPARLIREESATKELVRIATESLNNGLRPHLTRWQACFRNWYAHQDETLKTTSPQETQRGFPEYEELMKDLQRVNRELIQYAAELEKLVHGK